MKVIEKGMYHMPALDAKIESFEKQIDKELSLDAENNGLRNIPVLAEENINPYVSELHHKFEAMGSEAAATLQPSALISEVEESEKTSARKLLGLHNELNTAKEQATTHGHSLQGKQREHSRLRLPLGWVAVGVPILGDGLMYHSTFESYGLNFVESLFVCLALSMALAVLAHLFDRIVGLARTVWQRRAIAVGIVGSLGCMFYYFANTRAQHLSAQMNADNPHGEQVHFSPVPMVLFSLLLFIVAVFLNRFFFPTKEERKAMRQFDADLKAQQAHSDNIRRIEAEIEAVKRAHEELVQTNGSIYIYGGKLEERLIFQAKIAFAKWKRVNMMHRPDHGRPVCFNSDEYPFTFTRHFKPIEFQ